MRKIKKYFIIILLSIFTLTTVETSSLNFRALYRSGKGFFFRREKSSRGISKISERKGDTDILHYGILIKMA